MKKYVKYIALILLSYSCLDTVEMPGGILNNRKEPTVTTAPVINLIEKTLICEGLIVSNGEGKSILKRGFCWSTTKNEPTVSDSDTIGVPNSASEIFTTIINNIAGSKVYYIRAFAENEFGIAYGNTITYNSPLIWEQKANFPAFKRADATTFVLGDKLYITCGDANFNPMKETWEFDIANNNWQGISFFPGNARRQASVFTIRDSAYIGTGQEAGASFYKDFYALSKNQSWSPVEVPPILDRSWAVGFSLQDKGYIVGGRTNNSVFSDVVQYSADITEGSKWKKMNNFPIGIYSAVSFANKNSAFVGFGISREGDDVKNIWEYNEKNDSWDLFSSVPDSINIKSALSGVIIENKAYIISSDYEIWELDLATADWKFKASLPEAFAKNNTGQYLLAYKHSIFVGLYNTNIFYEYRPLWDSN